MQYKKFLLLIIIACMFVLSALAEKKLNGKVKATVNIAAKKMQAHVNLLYTIENPADTTNSFRFYFDRANHINFIKTANLQSYYRDTITRSSSVVIKLNTAFKKNEKAVIEFDYDIPLDSLNYHKYGFVELGLDWLWFPVHTNMSDWKFTFDLAVQTDDAALELFSNGTVKKDKEGDFRVRSIYPDFDIDLFLLKNPAVFTGNNKHIKVVGSAGNAPLKDSVANLIKQYLDLYNQWYSGSFKQVTCIFRPVINDPNGFGYSRQGYFVLSEPSKLSAIRFYVAHELAHFWWINGESTENEWITESFAEYNALLMVKHFEGDSAYNKIIREKYERVEKIKKDGRNVPAVFNAGSKNKSNFSHIALYFKGALILHELNQQVGGATMMNLLQEAAKKKITTTSQFLDLLSKHAGVATVDHIKDRLQHF